MSSTDVYHIRKPESTPAHPITYCGEDPQDRMWWPSWFTGDKSRYTPPTFSLLTSWELILSMPNMPAVCQKCVAAIASSRIVVNTAPTPEEVRQMVNEAGQEGDFTIPF